MDKRWIVDGYNALLRWRRGGLKPGPGNVERARDAFIAWIARRSPNPARVTIVFDAGSSTRTGLVDSRVHQVRVVFAEGLPSADDWIIRACDDARHDSNLTVVSNDRAIQLAARQARVQSLSSDAWLADLTSRGRAEGIVDPPEPAQASAPSVPPPDLTGKDLDEFREAMNEKTRTAEEPPSPPPPPASLASPKKDIKAKDDWEDFYKEMRRWNAE